MNSIPSWARRVLSPGDVQKIQAAVTAAEKSCGAEFVPVVVKSSSGTGHVPLSAGLLILFSVYFLRSSFPSAADAAWRPWYYFLGEALVAALLGWLASRFHAVQRLFTPRADREQSVHRRARLEFYKHHVEATQAGNGILLYVSLMERKAVVLCGKSIATKVPNEAWNGVVREMARGASSGSLGEGLAQAVTKAGGVVKGKLKGNHKAKNELSDRVVIKD